MRVSVEFSALGEVEQTLLLTKAIEPVPVGVARWTRLVQTVLRDADASAAAMSLQGLTRRIRKLVEAGWVSVDEDGWQHEYTMTPAQSQDVLERAHGIGLLARAIEHLFPVERRRFLEVEDRLWAARALLAAKSFDAAGQLLGERESRWLRRLQLEGDEAWPIALLGCAPPAGWLESVPDAVLMEYAKALGLRSSEQLAPMPPVIDAVLEELARRKLKPRERNPIELLRGAVLSMHPDRSAALLRRGTTATRAKMRLLHAFVAGDLERAYAEGLELFESPKASLAGLEAMAFALAALDATRRGVAPAARVMEAVMERASERPGPGRAACELLAAAGHVDSGVWDADVLSSVVDQTFAGFGEVFWPEVLVGGLVLRWFDVWPTPQLDEELHAWAEGSGRIEAPLLRASFAALASTRTDDSVAAGTLVEIYRSRAAWEHVVDGFESLAESLVPLADAQAAPFVPSLRWEISGEDGADGEASLSITARLFDRPGSRRGCAVRLEDILTRYAAIATVADTQAAYAWVHAEAELRYEADGLHRGGRLHRALTLRLAAALVGHPGVCRPGGTAVEVLEGEPSLVVEGGADGAARVFVEPAGVDESPIVVRWETPQRLRVSAFDEAWMPVLRLLRSADTTAIPAEAMQRLLPALTRLGGRVRLEGRGGVDLEGREVAPASGVEIDLQWQDPVLSLQIGVWPLGRDGPRCVPGDGSDRVVAHGGAGVVSTTRDLEAERQAAQMLRAACPRLGALPTGDPAARLVEGVVEGLEPACLMLEELTEAAAQGLVVLAWPRGKPLRLSREYTSADFNVRVCRGRADWLELDAGVAVDDGEVLAWQLLTQDAEGLGRFVRLGSAEIVRLSTSLRRKLQALRRLGPGGPQGTLAVPDVALPALSEVLGDDVEVSWAQDVVERRDEIEAALSSTPRLPGGLKATLRDYQREGVRWMLRLAAAGFGAVLADDMGLGKTVQSLAVLLARGKLGPAVVVCPTSVVGNWMAEARRFAPRLTVIDVGAVARSERAEVLRGLGPDDVAVLSYGLLPRVGEALGEQQLASLVYDEAHALKNARASRTQAATSIHADFRLGLTGTPVENHLGELWSVMNVCVPGLLGDAESFERGLARAISAGDASATEHLRSLLRPFLLRRTKEMVLAELPERTETLIAVQQSKRERAWYEAQRRRAVERLSHSDAPAGQARIQILAEIGRLRQAAVEPRLLDDRAPRGTKLDLVSERVQELVEAGHQVLVFTQFIRVLGMLDGRLRKRGVRTLELQGSTSAGERARRIEAFQAGEADVFLMSLRAGGVGVNLTAADYVIHVDPWWNPAVEDQASARAHRMGQTKPVTVYRFCTQESIEPKILALHESKRQLAEDILSGMSKSKRLDLDELRDLMR